MINCVDFNGKLVAFTKTPLLIVVSGVLSWMKFNKKNWFSLASYIQVVGHIDGISLVCGGSF